MDKKKITLGYWGIRGRAMVCRYLLEYTKTPYTQKVYAKQDEWFGKDSKELGLFANLPYLIDGDFKLNETAAIEQYIIRKSGKDKELLGADLKEIAEQIMIVSVSRYDLYYKALSLPFQPNFATEKDKLYAEQIKPYIEQLATQLGKKKFLMGDKVHHCDFIFYEALQYASGVFKADLSKFEGITHFMKNFEALPGIKEYMATDAYKKLPYLPF